jgi:hypothetical protein
MQIELAIGAFPHFLTPEAKAKAAEKASIYAKKRRRRRPASAAFFKRISGPP